MPAGSRWMSEMDEDAKQHTSVGEMAAECAKHHGTMILDVETFPDGHQTIHAVATWEDDEQHDHDLARWEGEGGAPAAR